METNIFLGAAFFLPHGVRIISRLKQLLRQQYRKFGYEEVMTPLVFEKDLWEKSGHYEHYAEHMFFLAEVCALPAFTSNGFMCSNKAVLTYVVLRFCPRSNLLYDAA